MKRNEIVIIDDNQTSLEFARDIFLKSDAISDVSQIKTILDPEDALEYVEENIEKIYLCVIDMKMPKLNGWEVAQELREIEETKFGQDMRQRSEFLPERLKIYILTGETNPTIMEPTQGVTQGIIDGYLIKPITESAIPVLFSNNIVEKLGALTVYTDSTKAELEGLQLR